MHMSNLERYINRRQARHTSDVEKSDSGSRSSVGDLEKMINLRKAKGIEHSDITPDKNFGQKIFDKFRNIPERLRRLFNRSEQPSVNEVADVAQEQITAEANIITSEGHQDIPLSDEANIVVEIIDQKVSNNAKQTTDEIKNIAKEPDKSKTNPVLKEPSTGQSDNNPGTEVRPETSPSEKLLPIKEQADELAELQKNLEKKTKKIKELEKKYNELEPPASLLQKDIVAVNMQKEEISDHLNSARKIEKEIEARIELVKKGERPVSSIEPSVEASEEKKAETLKRPKDVEEAEKPNFKIGDSVQWIDKDGNLKFDVPKQIIKIVKHPETDKFYAFFKNFPTAIPMKELAIPEKDEGKKEIKLENVDINAETIKKIFEENPQIINELRDKLKGKEGAGADLFKGKLGEVILQYFKEKGVLNNLSQEKQKELETAVKQQAEQTTSELVDFLKRSLEYQAEQKVGLIKKLVTRLTGNKSMAATIAIGVGVSVAAAVIFPHVAALAALGLGAKALVTGGAAGVLRGLYLGIKKIGKKKTEAAGNIDQETEALRQKEQKNINKKKEEILAKGDKKGRLFDIKTLSGHLSNNLRKDTFGKKQQKNLFEKGSDGKDKLKTTAKEELYDNIKEMVATNFEYENLTEDQKNEETERLYTIYAQEILLQREVLVDLGAGDLGKAALIQQALGGDPEALKKLMAKDSKLGDKVWHHMVLAGAVGAGMRAAYLNPTAAGAVMGTMSALGTFNMMQNWEDRKVINEFHQAVEQMVDEGNQEINQIVHGNVKVDEQPLAMLKLKAAEVQARLNLKKNNGADVIEDPVLHSNAENFVHRATKVIVEKEKQYFKNPEDKNMEKKLNNLKNDIDGQEKALKDKLVLEAQHTKTKYRLLKYAATATAGFVGYKIGKATAEGVFSRAFGGGLGWVADKLGIGGGKPNIDVPHEAIIGKGQGVEHVLKAQIKARPEDFGLPKNATPKQIEQMTQAISIKEGYRQGAYTKFFEEAMNDPANKGKNLSEINNIAFRNAMKSGLKQEQFFDTETRVSKPGAGYVLDKDSQGDIHVTETDARGNITGQAGQVDVGEYSEKFGKGLDEETLYGKKPAAVIPPADRGIGLHLKAEDLPGYHGGTGSPQSADILAGSANQDIPPLSYEPTAKGYRALGNFADELGNSKGMIPGSKPEVLAGQNWQRLVPDQISGKGMGQLEQQLRDMHKAINAFKKQWSPLAESGELSPAQQADFDKHLTGLKNMEKIVNNAQDQVANFKGRLKGAESAFKDLGGKFVDKNGIVDIRLKDIKPGQALTDPQRAALNKIHDLLPVNSKERSALENFIDQHTTEHKAPVRPGMDIKPEGQNLPQDVNIEQPKPPTGADQWDQAMRHGDKLWKLSNYRAGALGAAQTGDKSAFVKNISEIMENYGGKKLDAREIKNIGDFYDNLPKNKSLGNIRPLVDNRIDKMATDIDKITPS